MHLQYLFCGIIFFMIDYELALYIMTSIFWSVIIVMIGLSWFYVAGLFLSMKRIKKAPHSDTYTKFAVLVPARNESEVIKNIMRALTAQTYPKEYFDVWFIVEKDDDPTIKFAGEFGFKHFVRDEMTEQRRIHSSFRDVFYLSVICSRLNAFHESAKINVTIGKEDCI